MFSVHLLRLLGKLRYCNTSSAKNYKMAARTFKKKTRHGAAPNGENLPRCSSPTGNRNKQLSRGAARRDVFENIKRAIMEKER